MNHSTSLVCHVYVNRSNSMLSLVGPETGELIAIDIVPSSYVSSNVIALPNESSVSILL